MLGFPGFGQGDDPLPSGDPVLPDDVAQGLFGQQVADAQTGFQRTALLSGAIERKVDTMLQSLLTSLAGAAISRLDDPGGAHLPGAHLPGRPKMAPVTPPPSTPAPTTTAPATPAPAPAPAPADTDAKGDQTPSAIARYKEGLATGQGLTMGGVAKSAIRVGARYFTDRPTNWQKDPETGALTEIDSATGEPIGQPIAPGDSGYAMIAAKMRATAFVGGNLASMAGGGGAAGRLGMVVSKAAGPIGIAVGAGLAAGQFAEAQNEAAAGYRSAFGETGTGTFAGQERFGEFMAGLGGFGTVGGDRAREQYRQASALGLRDDRREGATDFASDMFMRFGMDTSESMKIVSQTLSQGNVSLLEFGDAITEVSRSAVEAGRSSQEAIKGFVDAQAYLAQNLTTGSASVDIAKQVAGIASDMPKGLSDALGGASGMAESVLSQQNVMRVASLTGQDSASAWWQAQNPDTAEGQALKTFGGTGDQIVALVASVMGYTPQDLKRRVSKMTGGELPPTEGPGSMWRIFEKLAGGSAQAGGIMSMALNHVATFFGMTDLDTENLLLLFFEACLDGFGKEAREENRSKRRKSRSSASRSPYKAGGDNADLLSSRLGISTVDGGAGPVTVGMPTDEAAYEEYSRRVDRYGGGGNQAIEALLSSENRDEIEEAAGVDDMSDVRYRVKNDEGKAVDLSLAEILKRGSHYTSQISSGRASIVNSEDPNAAPTSVTAVLELAGEAADLFRQKKGPSDEQRAGVPPSGVRAGPTPRYGGSR